MTTPNHDPDKTADWSPSPWGDGVTLIFYGRKEAELGEDVRVFGKHIRKGYLTDGASVPGRLARYTDLLPAALYHDEDYDPQRGKDGEKRRTKTRKEADHAFRQNVLTTLR